jgi:hypothetical protein
MITKTLKVTGIVSGILIGFVETDEVKEAQKLEVGPYLKKPLTLERLGLAIRDELKK